MTVSILVALLCLHEAAPPDLTRKASVLPGSSCMHIRRG